MIEFPLEDTLIVEETAEPRRPESGPDASDELTDAEIDKAVEHYEEQHRYLWHG